MSILLILNRLTQRHNNMYLERERERETYRDVQYCMCRILRSIYLKRNTCYSIGIHAINELIEYLMYFSHINFEKKLPVNLLVKSLQHIFDIVFVQSLQ